MDRKQRIAEVGASHRPGLPNMKPSTGHVLYIEDDEDTRELDETSCCRLSNSTRRWVVVGNNNSQVFGFREMLCVISMKTIHGPVVHCRLCSSSVLLRGLCATNVMSK